MELSNQRASTKFVVVDGGQLAIDDTGSGQLLVMLPGMGDLRQSYRFLAPLLVEAGYRVVTADLRGHGESSTNFESYGDAETANDIVALLGQLTEPDSDERAIVVGNSMSAGAAVLAAAENPELISGLVLIGPFVRNPRDVPPLQRWLMRVAMSPPWATMIWKMYFPSLFAGNLPEDMPQYRKLLSESLKRKGQARAFSKTTRTSHDAAEHALKTLSTPTLILMGASDPDFVDPSAEAQWIAEQVRGKAVMIPQSGHYPQAQQPKECCSNIVAFCREID